MKFHTCAPWHRTPGRCACGASVINHSAFYIFITHLGTLSELITKNMNNSIIVVKLGGTEGVDFSAICNDAAELLKQGKQLVLVHGGSAEANSLGDALGIPPKMIT